MTTSMNNRIVYAAHAAAKAQDCRECQEIAVWGETSNEGRPQWVKARVQGCPLHTAEVTIIPTDQGQGGELHAIVRTHRGEAGMALARKLLENMTQEVLREDNTGENTSGDTAGEQAA